MGGPNGNGHIAYGNEYPNEDYNDGGDYYDYWPTWEMTGAADPWTNNAPINNGNEQKYDGLGGFGGPSIADCERFFTVPPTAGCGGGGNERQRNERQLEGGEDDSCSDDSYSNYSGDDDDEDGDDECSPFDCLNPWKATRDTARLGGRGNNMDVDAVANLTCEEEGGALGLPPAKLPLREGGVIKRTSKMAVQRYMGMPIASCRTFTPQTYLRRERSIESNGSHWRGNSSGGDEDVTAGMSLDSMEEIVDHNFDIDSNPQEAETGAEANHDVDKASGSSESETNRECRRKGRTKRRRPRHRVRFNELKRVLQITRFSPEEAFSIWWQKVDYARFKASMGLLVQGEEAPDELVQVWLNNYMNDDNNGNSDGGSGPQLPRTLSGDAKWWHDYDHSRRGLERYASRGQARQILASSRVAVKKVLAEQSRQRWLRIFKMFGVGDGLTVGGGKKCNNHTRNSGSDTNNFNVGSRNSSEYEGMERISEIYHEYTAWSRDLALAAGASDADAVRTNFDDTVRHTREYYVLKQVLAAGHRVHRHMPQFMLPDCIEPKGFIDETTACSSSRYSESRGNDAREKMSKVTKEDLEGPMPPHLAPIFEAEKKAAAGKTMSEQQQAAKNNQALNLSQRAKAAFQRTTATITSTTSPKVIKKACMTSSAKNYPY